ncbi:MAG: hypothetical protein NT105_23855 [Verrucomicrobia bacterium]|nr:hypothetical protein [Verrucomicrobiota bacterium]
MRLAPILILSAAVLAEAGAQTIYHDSISRLTGRVGGMGGGDISFTSANGRAGVPEEMRTGGKVYPNVRFGPAKGEQVFVSWNGGSGWMHAMFLPEEVQRRFGFNTAQLREAREAAELESARVAEIKRQERIEKYGETFNGKVQQVIKDGLLVSIGESYGVGDSLLLTGHPKEATMIEDIRIRFLAKPAGRYQFVSVTGATRTISKWSYIGEPHD